MKNPHVPVDYSPAIRQKKEIPIAEYDARMHKCGPESIEALSELQVNSENFAFFSTLIAKHWQAHNTLVGFAMDHGCHEIDGGCGAHGLDMEEDLNIVHLYKAYPAIK